jgi:hypothetical protein
MSQGSTQAAQAYFLTVIRHVPLCSLHISDTSVGTYLHHSITAAAVKNPLSTAPPKAECFMITPSYGTRALLSPSYRAKILHTSNHVLPACCPS